MAPHVEKEKKYMQKESNQDADDSMSSSKNHKEYKPTIVWRNVILFIFLHTGALYGVYSCFYASYKTLFFAYFLYVCGGLGITGGAHRLWAHRTYKAKLPLRILLGLFQTIALQNSIYEWSRDHRVHHKYTETDADPHNAHRGLFFSHMGWLLLKKHPDVIKKGSQIPLDDLLKDPVVYYQKKYYKTLAIFFCFIMPTIVPVLLWNESVSNAYFISGILRYVFTLHATWLVNSVAHMWGFKPYDKRINPVENILVSIGAIGEGFHNFHHTFPRDYSTSEFGSVYFNFTKGFIDFMAILGQAYDRNKTSDETIQSRKLKTGDLTSELHYHQYNSHSKEQNHEHEY